MTNKLKTIALDAMGGDNAPAAQVKGAQMAVEKHSDIKVVLYGDEKKIKEHLTIKSDRIEIVHTDVKINSDDDPTRSFRQKPDASMVLAVKAVKEGTADAVLSSGNTGAYLTTSLFVAGRIKGISRPALCPVFPTLDGEGFVFLDVGANAEVKAENLMQFAQMGNIYAEKVRGIKNPRIGLLNIGAEENKGIPAVIEAHKQLKESNLNFVGNVEPRDLLNGGFDVLVADGYAGNMVLKAFEGTAKSIGDAMKKNLMSSLSGKIGGLIARKSIYKVKEQLDYEVHGGAVMIGLKAPVIKQHGSANETSVYYSLVQASAMAEANFCTEIENAIKEQGV